jgi:hypothetical protein
LYFLAILFPCFAERAQPCGKKQFRLSSKRRITEQTSEALWGNESFSFYSFQCFPAIASNDEEWKVTAELWSRFLPFVSAFDEVRGATYFCV